MFGLALQHAAAQPHHRMEEQSGVGHALQQQRVVDPATPVGQFVHEDHFEFVLTQPLTEITGDQCGGFSKSINLLFE